MNYFKRPFDLACHLKQALEGYLEVRGTRVGAVLRVLFHASAAYCALRSVAYTRECSDSAQPCVC